MVGVYTALPPAVAATVPRRSTLRESWIRHQPTMTSSESPTVPASSAPSSPVATPPMTPRSSKGLKQMWDTPPRPASMILTTYSAQRSETSQELHGIAGKVSRAKAFFESSPLQHWLEVGEGEGEKPLEPIEETIDTVVSYRIKNPYRISPRPKLRRYRNTISTFPRFVSKDDTESKDDSDSESQVIITDVSPPASIAQEVIEVDPPIEITRIKPSFIRRRYGTVTGLITDRSNIEEALRKRLSATREKRTEETAKDAVQREEEDDDAGDATGDDDGVTDTGGMEGRRRRSNPGSDEIGRARVALTSAAENTEEEEVAVSTGRDGAWNRRIGAPSYSPPPSCRCEHATVVVSRDDRSECQGSAAEGHASSKTMVVPEDGQVQTAAPRVVAVRIKSYHDIPEDLFNSLQESSVDPHPPSSPPPPPPPLSSPPTSTKTTHATASPPTPAPRNDWKSVREGRKALLLMGEVSDADTEEGSEVDLVGVASTSDYHTSDGRGSSLSGASDDHHRPQHDNNHKNDYSFNHHHHHPSDYHHNLQDADEEEEEGEFECYNHQVSAPTVIIRNNFRGFCSTMLGSPSMPSTHDYLPPPARPPPPSFSSGSRSPTPPDHDLRPASASSLLEEELRAAGIYFRRPGSPPRVPSRSRTLSPPPPPKPSSSSSSKTPKRNSLGEAEAVAAALHVLDASLAGLSDSSGESSPARSHASTVVERRQCSLDPTPVDIHFSDAAAAASTATRLYVHSPPPKLLDSSDNPDSASASAPSLLPGYCDLNDSDASSAVEYAYEPSLNNSAAFVTEDNIRFSGVENIPENHALGVKSGGSGGVLVGGECGRASANVGGTEEDGGPYGQAPHHHHNQSSKEASAMENFNLIEEVYVDTRPVTPRSTVSMRAYYPGVHYSSSSTSSPPKDTLKPPVPTTSRHPERGASLDSTQTLPADSDSGHESGATSPCGTLILDDTQSPPPSPPNNHALKTQSTSIHTHTSSISHSRTSSLQSCRGPGVLEGEVGVAVVGDPTHTDVGVGGIALEARPPTHFVVVAIDFGTTYSGYAFSFIRDPDSIHMMKKWEGGDPGVQNQKTPTIVLLTPEEEFHSLGFVARDTYHDLDPKEAKKWLYFDKFKMALHADQTLSRDTLLEAANGRKIPALKIFSYALKYFSDHALKELSDQAGVEVLEEDIRWVITVPAIWSHPAKQFMRTAAYQAGMGSSARPEQLLIALEPEAAAIYCRRLRRHQLLPERPSEPRHSRRSSLKDTSISSSLDSTSSVSALPELDREELVSLPYRSVETVADWLKEDTVYAVVDCGGGTVDITVHQMTDKSTGHLKELHKATGGPHGSTGVDGEFERLLESIFGADFLQTFRQQRPAAYVDLMIAFESRKRNASPYRSNPLNIALPFSFIDLYRKFRGKDVEWAMKKHQNLGVKWSAQGMLRVEQDTMRQLFLPTLTSITQAIDAVLSAPEVGHLQYMFLVGGFAESELLQKHIRDTFGHRVNVIIPQGMGLAILRGAVQFGLDPGVVTVRRSRLTYGVGVLNRYQRGLHPSDKRVVAAGSEWCADVLDRFVAVDESVAIGDVVIRPYTPATPGQSTVILHLYATDRHDAKFVTEDGVQRVGTLHLELGAPVQDSTGTRQSGRREITVHMKFGDTEVKASAVDHLSGQIVRANIDFLTL